MIVIGLDDPIKSANQSLVNLTQKMFSASDTCSYRPHITQTIALSSRNGLDAL